LRSAPPIRIAVAANRPWLVVVRLVAVSSVLTAAAWAMDRRDTAESAGYAAGCWLLVLLGACAAAWAWRAGSGPGAVLEWDGQGWSVHGPADAGGHPHGVALRVTVDLGGWLLVRCQEQRDGRQRDGRFWERRRTWWLPLQCGADRARWHALRCALYARPAGATQAAPTVR
jgi:hypothetical protein